MRNIFPVCLAMSWFLLANPAFAQIAGSITEIQDRDLPARPTGGQALASSPSGVSGVLVHGTHAADLSKLIAPPATLRAGTLEGFDEGGAVAIGRALAERLSLGVGDGIALVAPANAVAPTGGPPRLKTYKIAAVFETGISSYDDTFVFMPLREARAYFGR